MIRIHRTKNRNLCNDAEGKRRGKKLSGLALASQTRGGRRRRIIENIFQRVLIRTCAAFDPRFCTFLPLDTLQLAVATRKKPMIQDQGGGRGRNETGEEHVSTGGGRGGRRRRRRSMVDQSRSKNIVTRSRK